MKRYLIAGLLLLLMQGTAFSQTRLYAQSVPAFSGDSTISLERFRGKAILLVNVASGNDSLQQFAALQQLAVQLAGEDVVIIACPSNSFGNEPGSTAYIKSVYPGKKADNFVITSPMTVAGEAIAPLYDWLADKSKNGVMTVRVKADWTKILISRAGQLIGYFSPQVLADSDILLTAIKEN